MTCSKYRDLLSRYVDDEVTPRQRRELLDHVQNCPHCAAWLARVRQTDVLLKGVPETHPSDRVRDAVLNSAVPSRSQQVHQQRPHFHAPFPGGGGWHLDAAGMLLRFDLSTRRIALASAAALLSIVGLAYWMNILPPLWGYNQFGFLIPGEQEQAPVSSTPMAAISSGIGGVGGPVAVPNPMRTGPVAGAQGVPVNEAMWIRFDQPMDRASVESAITVDPPAAGVFGWDADNELRFLPSGAGLLRGVTYTVSLSNSARSLAGTSLADPLSWQFRTREPVSVSPSTEPGSSVPPTAIFTLRFDTPMNAEEAGRAIMLRSTTLDADLPATLTWDAEARSVVVAPNGPMPPGEVALHVASGARTQSGEALGVPVVYTYSVALPTPRLRLLGDRLDLIGAGRASSVEYEALAGPEVPLDGVTFSVFALPGERLSALGAQARNWPAPLPADFTAGLVPVATVQGGFARDTANPGFGTQDLPPLAPGTYLLVSSARSSEGALSDWLLLVAANRSLTLLPDGALWAAGEAGGSWTGAEISVYSPPGQLLAKGVSDAVGLYAPPAHSGATLALARDLEGNLAAALLDPASTPAVDPSLGSLAAALHTDQPEYLPGQTVNFRAIVSQAAREDAMPGSLAEEDVSVTLLNPGSLPVAALTLKPDDVGGVGGVFALAPDIQPGRYAIRVGMGQTWRDFPLLVAGPPNGTLSVYIAPRSVTQDPFHSITHTVSVLGVGGQPASDASLTATLRIRGDEWVSMPVTATADSNGRAQLVVPLPDWTALHNDPGLYLQVEAVSGAASGTSETPLDLASVRRLLAGVGDLVSPHLGIVAIAQPQEEGSTRLRVLALEGSDVQGDMLVRAISPSGAHQAWSFSLEVAGGDVTLPIPADFAGGSVYLSRAGLAGYRYLALPRLSDVIELSVTTPPTAIAGSLLPISLSLLDLEGSGLPGTSVVWFRRVSTGAEHGPLSWEPSLQIGATGTATATLAAPQVPGLWYVYSSAATSDGALAYGWSVVEMLPAPAVQLPPAMEMRSGEDQAMTISIYNPLDRPLSTGVRTAGDGSLQVVGDSSQGVDVPAGGWQRLEWRAEARQVGPASLTFSFMPSASIGGIWTLRARSIEGSNSNTTFAAGVLAGQQTVGVQVPSGLQSEDVRLEVRASTSLLSALSDMAGAQAGEPGPGSVASAAARLGAGPSIASAYRRAGLAAPAGPALSGVERSLALQQLYSSQHADGGWGAVLDPAAGASTVVDTANVLLAMRRQSLAGAEASGAPQLAIDASVVSRALSYLARETARPVTAFQDGAEQPAGDTSPRQRGSSFDPDERALAASEGSASSLLDERARALYVLALYGAVDAEAIRPYMAYTASTVDGPRLSRTGQAWLALALWQAGGTGEGIALLDRLLQAPGTGSAGPGELVPMLEALVVMGSAGPAGAAQYASVAQTYARDLMETRQGALWSSPALSADALWSLSRYAAQEPERLSGAPTLVLNDHGVQISPQPDNGGTVSVVISGGALHAGTNWLKLQAPAGGRPLYYSLTLKASR